MRPAALPWDNAPIVRTDLMTRLRIRYNRAIRWEFWPAWLYYLPIVGWVLWLSLRYRSLTVFTAANPGIASGGMVGENKHEILEPLQNNAPDLVAEFILVPASDFATRVALVTQFVTQVQLPIVLKPNIGGRGRGVMIARCEQDIVDYLHRCTGEIMAQRYVEGDEFGIFIARSPEQSTPDIISIVHKTFPQITADGVHTLRELILADARAQLISAFLFKRWAHELNQTPPKGQVIDLVEIGAHCRGSVFLNATHLDSPALRDTLTRLLDATSGYAFGRIDLRAPSSAALTRGEGLQVIELNGVTSESAHIYHPDTPLLTGYRAMFHQWSIAFKIGDAYAKRGAHVTTLREILSLWREDMRRGEAWF